MASPSLRRFVVREGMKQKTHSTFLRLPLDLRLRNVDGNTAASPSTDNTGQQAPQQ